MEVEEKYFYSVSDVKKVMGCSDATAYRIIRQLNNELKTKGKLTMQGKVNRKYFLDKVTA